MTGPKFKVIAQTPTLVQNAQGQYVQGWHITAQLESGTTFAVDVPDQTYTVDNVKALLAGKAEHVQAVDQIGH